MHTSTHADSSAASDHMKVGVDTNCVFGLGERGLRGSSVKPEEKLLLQPICTGASNDVRTEWWLFRHSDSCRVEEFSVQGQVESKALGSLLLEGMQRGRLPAQSFSRCLGLRLSDFQCMKLWRGVLREFETHAFFV